MFFYRIPNTRKYTPGDGVGKDGRYWQYVPRLGYWMTTTHECPFED